MIFIDEMKNLKIYKRPFFLPHNDKDKKHGSLVYLLTPNYLSSTNQMKLPYLINRRYFESYYFEKDVTMYLGKAKAVKESYEEAIDTNSVYQGFDFDNFTAYAIKGEVESDKFSTTIEDALKEKQAPNGTYEVYTHTIDNKTPVKIGEIAVQVIEYTDYKALYKWISFVDFEPMDEEYIEERSIQKGDVALYHLSYNKLDGKTVYPSIPVNFLTKNGYEDSTTKRVCFSNSIEKCLRAFSKNLTGDELYVNIPVGDYDIYKPTVSEVPDSKITGEVWITKPVKMKTIGKIKVIGDDGKDGIKYTYGDNRSAMLYNWEYKYINEATDSLNPIYSIDIKRRWNVVSKDGANNACVDIDGYEHPFRGRSSILIIKGDRVFVQVKDDGDVSAPGGGWEPNENPIDAAIREAKEEVRINVKNVKHMGHLIEYHEVIRDWVAENVPKKDWWYGYYSEIFVGEYDSDYTGHVDDADKDEIINKGKFYLISEIIHVLPEEYASAIRMYLLSKGKVDTNDTILYDTDKSNIYYNMDALDRGETNVLFVASGTSDSSIDDGNFDQIIDLNDIIVNNRLDDKDLKKNNDLVFTFFDKYGKDFRIPKNTKIGEFVKAYKGNDYFADIVKHFVGYVKAYADSHSRSKFLVKGVQLFPFISPDDIIDYAVSINCADDTVSFVRKVKENIENSYDKIPETNGWIMEKLKVIPEYPSMYEAYIRKWRDFYKNKAFNYSESVIFEDNEEGSNSLECLNLPNKLKYKIRSLKMNGKKGKYAINKQIRDGIESLPTPEDIVGQIEVGPKNTIPNPGDSSSNNESASLLRILESINDSSLYYMLENEFIVFNEKGNANDMQLRKLLYADRIRNQKQVLLIYKKLKDELSFIKYTFPTINRYDGRNLFYDLSYYMEIFFRNNEYPIAQTLKIFTEFMKRILSKNNVPDVYGKRTVFIPILAWDSDPKVRTFLFRDGVNPISVIYYMLQHNSIGELKKLFGDMDIIFTANDKYFKINFSTLTLAEEKTIANTFKRFITKIKANELFDADDVDNEPDVESSKVIATNIIDKIEASQGIDMSKQYTGISRYIGAGTAFLDGINKGKTPETIVKTSASTKPILLKNNTVIQNPKDATISKQQSEIKKAVANDVEKTTTSKAITPEAKKQKIVDKETIELQKDQLTQNIVNIAATAKNTDEAIDAMDVDHIKRMIMDLAVEEDPTIKINKARAARMMQLNNDIVNTQINGVSIKDLLDPEISKKKNDAPLPETTIKVDSPFKDQWENLKYMNFDKTYDINADITKMLMALANKQYPLSMRNITVEDASNVEDYIDKYHIEFEDFRGKRFTINLDIPKFKNNKYLILRGYKKTIQNQYFNIPILKTDQDTVQVISNYNKIFIRRFGNTTGKSITYVDRIIKAAKRYTGKTIKFVQGDNSKLAEQYDMPIDYIDISSVYNTIDIKDECTLYFNQKLLRDKYADKIDVTRGFPIGVKSSGEIMYYDYQSVIEPISTYIAQLLCNADKDFEELYNATKSATKYVYSQASIMNVRIPLIIVCAYSEGLTPVLKKANIDYELVEKLTNDDRKNVCKDWIKFSDGYLVYHVDYASSLLLNGLKEIDTEAYSIDQINSKRIYTEMLDNYGGRIKADGIENFYECMLDPITLEVLEHYKLPTDYIELLLYGNSLLSDNKYISHGDSSSRRIRRNELIAVKVYKALFNDAYATYANTLRHNMNNATFSVKESAVIDKFMTDTISSDLSVINCLNDIETTNAVTTKGESGMNSARAYTLDKRTYDASMLNLLGMSTGFAGNVGITRQATINMNIDTARGYIKSIEGDTSKMDVANTMTITEAVNPMGATRDDPIRSAMTFIQTAKHQVRTKKSDPLLVTNGSDSVLPYLTTDIFCKKADMAGKVISVDAEKMVVQYTNRKYDYIELANKIEKNSDGGFYVNIKLEANGLTAGKKFNAGDILAYEKGSFSKKALGESDNLVYNVGKLAKVAIINSDDNFEDSAMVTSKLAEDLSTDVIMKEARILTKNTNVYNFVPVGTEIQQEDVLFETQIAYEEEDVNALLRTLAGDSETISRLNRRPVRSSVTGKVVGINLYRTCEIEEMSPSLQKIFKEYENKAKKTQKYLQSIGITDPTITPSTKKLPPIGKLKNAPDCVLIEYYLQYHDILAVGDKISYWSANKGVIHNIVESSEAPFTDFRPDEEISAFTGISSINKRQIASNIIVGSLNKLCIELGRQCRDKLGIPYYDNELDI